MYSRKIRGFSAYLFGLMMLTATCTTFAEQTAMQSDDSELSALTAKWWQWALSVPTSVNPLEDATGVNCMVGQRGAVWFLAGSFFGGTAARSCAVPQGTALFFPVVNAVQINTPNICGQQGALSISTLRAMAATFIDGTSGLSVSLDNKPVTALLRIKSVVFGTDLPSDNVFDAFCGGANSVPANIYSPSVDDGIYVLLEPLKVGQHSLHIHAENPSQNFVEDVTYVLSVIRITTD